ncbi:hypothetical protein EUX98_g7657 [Antrodiella citrinella]|uniref:Dynactin subunit 4 n=1 Tax=Antrodiella citrinella TaxID=2447956 RepID=A0A4S4MMN4_9APHY|nr:hypothetical protein EUX98_g7657 [Antrodiella citrinella]
MCPNCSNTLTVVPSDPPDTGDSRTSPIAISTVGEPPFFLYCNHCRWDSAEVDITFEKPTGLAAQLQKFEDSAPESLEFERLKEHFEPYLRASTSSSTQPSNSSHHAHLNPITAAASSALARDISGVGKYNPLARSRSGREKAGNKQEIAEYRARVEVGAAGGMGSGSGAEGDVDFMKHLETVEEVASVDQRWVNSWATSLHTNDLKPLRIPLHSKKSKRCPSCRHILIKPEQKAQSVRYKIKLVAANYLPAISVSLPHAQAALEMIKRSAGRAGSTAASEEHTIAAAGGMIAGKTYPFHLSFTNPLYDPIQVRLHVQRAVPTAVEDIPEGKAPRAPFAVTLPSSAFPIAAYAEAWEYEDDEDMFGDEDDFEGARGTRDREGRGKTRAVGVLERRANVTVVGGEIVLGKEARGTMKFNMLVTYTYRSDDPEPDGETEGLTPSKTHGHAKVPELKTFSFYTVVELGNVVRRDELKMDTDA